MCDGREMRFLVRVCISERVASQACACIHAVSHLCQEVCSHTPPSVPPATSSSPSPESGSWKRRVAAPLAQAGSRSSKRALSQGPSTPREGQRGDPLSVSMVQPGSQWPGVPASCGTSGVPPA